MNGLDQTTVVVVSDDDVFAKLFLSKIILMSSFKSESCDARWRRPVFAQLRAFGHFWLK